MAVYEGIHTEVLLQRSPPTHSVGFWLPDLANEHKYSIKCQIFGPRR
jgi:hypothetical protein